MGRAERRIQDRKNRIANRKGKILMSPQEVSKMKRDIIDDVASFKTEALMTCFALAEHRVYGFGATRIMKTLQMVDDLMGGILDESATLDDYIKELKEETGVIVKCDE